MNIIDKQRETVILENNTAQRTLVEFLEKLTRRSGVIEIKEPLHGDLDFSVLRNSGFTFVHTIVLNQGEITSVINLPEGITHFTCRNNFLIDLDKLPSSLTHLDLDYNYLESIDLSPCKILTSVHLSNNRLKKLEDLPTDLTEIFADNNELLFLKLARLYRLKTLHVSNNKISIIEDLPENLADFQMENNPSIQFVNSPIVPMKRKEDVVEQEATFVESLHQYFRMKGIYETTVHALKKKVFKDAPNKKIGKKRLLELKPKCIHCARPVGTIFSISDNRYKAICGDTNNPCNLNIEIYKGEYSNLYDMIDEFKHDIDEIKEKIICQKLDTIFDYVSQEKSAARFKEELENYNTDGFLYKVLVDKHEENYSNEHKMDIIDKKRSRIFMFQEQIKGLLDEYEKTQNREFLKTAMTLQINNLLPETRNLRLLTNEVMEINEHKFTNGKIEYNLFQYPISLSKTQYEMGEPPRVIKFAK